jgi:hypothetical protein
LVNRWGMGQEGHIFIMPERVWHVVHEPGQAPSFLGVNLIKVSTIGEVGFGRWLPQSDQGPGLGQAASQAKLSMFVHRAIAMLHGRCCG